MKKEKEMEKSFMRYFPPVIKLILLHTVVGSHYTHHFKNGMLNQKGKVEICSKF